MPYVERVTKAGNTIEIERYFTSRYKKKGISRGDKVKPTKEEQEKVNTRQAERKLRILINANYGYGDYHLVLDYIRRKGQPDRTPEQMRQDIDVFLRECRKEYRKAGLQSEETITLLAIENSKPHKDGLLFRICQYVEFKQKARRENEKL